MDDTIATASKDYFSIKYRKFKNEFISRLQYVFEEDNQPVESVLCWPQIENQEQLYDLANRLGWYLPRDSFKNCEIHIVASPETPKQISPPQPQAQFDTDHLSFVFHPPSEDIQFDGVSDRILLWDSSRLWRPPILRNIGKTKIVDQEYFSTVESTSWANVTNEIRNPVDDASEQNYRGLSSSEEYPASYVFATGPSLDKVFDIEIPEDALSIICNSIVRNDELLQHLQPDVLVFADPVFHFGPSRYAHKFRQDAIKVLRQYDCKAVIPSHYHSLLAGHFPELSNQFIGFNSVPAEEPIYPTPDQLEVMSTANIMTLFMLPIAMSLTDDVRIVGADGREKNESYFWEHSGTAQYDDELMETVAKTHPSFFRDRIYEDYYDQHVETLTEMIEYGERDGIQFRNLTHSYIPCLSERRVDPTALKT
ncbi:hypothetical protein [Haloglomus halophilum]|uniref:hypothetical protein n=1 Tax=Haloglomus halophilum TaxID=2962672 RepID=UPI0020C9C3D4|nr:hypothetical protein [Haloglomus halophilum]